MLLCKPAGQALDFKYSSYKKLGKFLTAMEREGFIIYKEANKKFPTAQITKVQWMSDKLENFEATIESATQKDVWVDTKKQASAEDWSTSITVDEICIPKKNVEFFFTDFQDKGNWTFDEAMKHFDTYLKKNKLINKDNVIINDTLRNTFGLDSIVAEQEAKEAEALQEEGMINEDEGNKKKKKVKTKQGETQNVIKRDLLNEKYIKTLDFCHEIFNKETGKKVVKKGRFGGITITAEKSHNKQITRIVGLTFFNANLDKLATHFQTKFASSCSVGDLPDKKNPGKELVVQGPWIHDIQDFISREMKINEAMIKTINKLARLKKEGMY